MKSIYLLFFLLISFLSNAQEDLNRTWFLTELTMSGSTVNIPNTVFSDLSIDTSTGEYIGSLACNGHGGLMINFTDTTITIESYNQTLDVCDIPEESAFEGAMSDFFGNPQPQDFSYSINEDSLEFTQLTLIKSNGDQAIYGTINSNVPSDISQEGWYLDYYEIDGVAQNPPTNQENQLNDFTISLFNDSNEVQQDFVCLFGGNGVFSTFNYFGVPTISIGFLATLADECINTILADYDYLFLMQLEGKTHTYEIIEEGQGRHLILTDINGDRIFYTNAFLNTEEFGQDISIQLFPNPSLDKITITGDHINRIQSYQIIDIQGRIISQNIFDTIIDVESLATGMYFLKLQGIQTETTRRFIKK
ncbi:T9SS type A sorting domain-containing protein [Dokdonia sp.]|uniref:T9SS type A sorting domain-containing protein n=1 Tax=Dokdonia sp. TaxID=2024995 RepID=UPI0032660E91